MRPNANQLNTDEDISSEEIEKDLNEETNGIGTGNDENEISASDVAEDVKDPLSMINLGAPESAAFDNIFDDTDDTDDELELNASQQSEHEVEQSTEIMHTSPGGTERTTKILDDDLEITYEVGAVVLPMNPAFQVKSNDILSGNIPFKENVSVRKALNVFMSGLFQFYNLRFGRYLVIVLMS